jgi:hypothetical protein
MTNLKKRMVGCLHFTVCCIIVFVAIVCCLKSLIAAIFRSLLALPDFQAEGPVEMVQASQQDPLWLLYGFYVFEILQTCLGMFRTQKSKLSSLTTALKLVTICPFFNLQSAHQVLDGPILLPMLCHSLA